jgi:NDP-sugar pyrophosphorylase family protein
MIARLMNLVVIAKSSAKLLNVLEVNDLQAVFLVGGKATRLGEICNVVPKPMLDVNGRPFILRTITKILGYGFDKIHFCCAQNCAPIQDYFGDKIMKTNVTYTVELNHDRGGTAGALLLADQWLDDVFFVFNGDVFFDFDYRLLELTHNAIATIALRKVPDCTRFGSIELGYEPYGDKIHKFSEKARAGAGLINGGVYLMRKDILQFIRKYPYSLEYDVFPELAHLRYLNGHRCFGRFIDIGTPNDLERARRELW